MGAISPSRRSRAMVVVGTAAAVLLVVAALFSSAVASGRGDGRALRRDDPARVEIDDFAFHPRTLRVARGSRVIFANRDTTVHTVVRRGSFRTGRIRPGRSATVRLRRAGVYKYHCSLHPFMRGKIVVR